MFCSKCGTQCADNLSFCPNCGSALAANQQSDNFNQQLQEDAQQWNQQPQNTQQWNQQPQNTQQWNQQPQNAQQWNQQPQYNQQWNQQPQNAQQWNQQPQNAQQWNQQPQYNQQWNQQPQYGQPQYGQPQYGQPQYGQPQYGQPYYPGIPMKWANFLGYFAIWAGALGNLITAFVVFSGSQYGGWAGAIYSFFPAMKTIDMLFGVLLIAISGFSIFAGVCLVTRKRLTLKLVPTVYLVSSIVAAIYLFSSMAVVGTDALDGTSVSSSITSMLTSVAFFFVNLTYFKKRESIYIN